MHRSMTSICVSIHRSICIQSPDVLIAIRMLWLRGLNSSSIALYLNRCRVTYSMAPNYQDTVIKFVRIEIDIKCTDQYLRIVRIDGYLSIRMIDRSDKHVVAWSCLCWVDITIAICSCNDMVAALSLFASKILYIELYLVQDNALVTWSYLDNSLPQYLSSYTRWLQTTKPRVL